MRHLKYISVNGGFKMSWSRVMVTVFLGGLLLAAFQNCGGMGFEVKEDLDLPSVANAASPVPANPVMPTPAPVPGVSFSENAASAVLSAGSVQGIQADQIYQRKDNGLATINLNLMAAVAAGSSAYYNISLLNSSQQRAQLLASGSRGSQTSFSFQVSTGMASNRVRLSFHDAQGVERVRWDSALFSVGEVFIVAGQSNSSNHGEYQTASSSSLNRAINPATKTVGALADPLPYATSWSFPEFGGHANPGGSPWPSFADELASKLKVPVAIVSVGWGGSGVTQWQEGNSKNYFNRLILAAQAVATNCGFRAVLWHQGETDAVEQMSTATYQNTLQSVASSFRRVTGCAQPWMIARASAVPLYGYPANTSAETIVNSELRIRAAQNNIGKASGFRVGPDTDLMLGAYRYDSLHFAVPGLILHGKLWAQRVLPLVGQPVFLEEKDLVPEVKTIWSLYKSILNRTDADMEQDREGLRYWVQRLSLGLNTAAQISSILSGSDEAYIRSVYVGSFARQPSWAELTRWLGKLASGEIANRTQLQAASVSGK
jgi:hypothetical protein